MSNYTASDTDFYAAVFSALSNPNRLQIYAMLSGCCEPGAPCLIDSEQPCCVGDIGKHLDIAPSTLSHHLKELSRANLIQMNREGKQVYCRVNSVMMKKIRAFFNEKPVLTMYTQG